MNQCGESGSGKKGFYPKAQHSSTRDGNLVVKNVGNTLAVQERGTDFGGTYTTNLRFQYEPSKKGETITRLLGFSGGFVKDSAVLKKVLTIEYVPLKGGWQVLTLECGVLVPGIE